MRNARTLLLEFSPSPSCHTPKYTPSLLSLRHLVRLLRLTHPCWSPGARSERLAVSPTLSFASVVALPGWFVIGQSEFPSPCGYSGGGKVASERIGSMFMYSRSCRRSRGIFGVSVLIRCLLCGVLGTRVSDVLAFAAGCRGSCISLKWCCWWGSCIGNY